MLPLLLAVAVVFWLVGFDIIYAVQDYEFDRAHGLHSLVVRWGVANALAASFLATSLMWGLLAVFGLLARIPSCLLCGPGFHFGMPGAGALAGAAARFELDSTGLFPPQRRHQRGVSGCDADGNRVSIHAVQTVNFFLQHEPDGATFTKRSRRGSAFSDEEALRLFESQDLNALGAIADLACRRKNGNRASYIVNRYINYSNYCILSCQFCAFARKKRDADGMQLTVEEIVQKAREALALGVTELHIVGGLHPSLPFSYYTDMLRALQAVDARLQLKCFTAIEILHLAWLAKKSVAPDACCELREAGLDSLTGGGAEIFRKEIRSQIARGKESAEEYLDVHRAWHQMGGRSTCTMLYGHVESLADRVDHLRQLARLAG